MIMSLRRLNRALLNAAVFTAVGQSVFAQTQSPTGNPSTQATTPSAQPATNANRPARPVSSNTPKPPQKSRFSSLSDVPYMMGDTPSGAGGVFQLGGIPNDNSNPNVGLLQTGSPAVRIGHPSFGGSRINIAENNSPFVTDRFYVNYRHFHNATDIDVLGYTPTGGRNSLDINTWTFGLERKLTDNSSLDVRLPINTQLASNLNITQTTGPITAFPLNDTDSSIGNLGLIYKVALLESDAVYWSAGAALNLPTAPNVSIRTDINDNQFQNYDPVSGIPLGAPSPFQLSMNARYQNDTVNLTPFVASIVRPTSSTYGMSFLQLDVPLNPSRFGINGTSFSNGFQTSAFDLQGRVDQQVLLRANLAAGKWLWQNDRDRMINSVGLQSEMHYTTSLNDADVLGPTTAAPTLGLGSDVGFGNTANRNDLLDTVIAVQAVFQQTLITNGFAVPIRTGSDRVYDFEYSLSVNRRF